MQRTEMLAELKDYIIQNILDGIDEGLNEETPLLEWGIINSLEIIKLLNFIREQFDIDVPNNKIVADNFTSLNAITDMLLEIENMQKKVVDR